MLAETDLKRSTATTLLFCDEKMLSWFIYSTDSEQHDNIPIYASLTFAEAARAFFVTDLISLTSVWYCPKAGT